MSWNSIAPGAGGHDLRLRVMRAIQDAYDENVRRFAPDDLGDNNITFGVSVSQNLRHLPEREVDGIEGVEVLRPRNSFVLRLHDRFVVHFYKAPPGIFDVRALRFDESEMKIELAQVNADQLSFTFEGLAEAPAAAAASLPTHVVVVHFGDPIGGLHRVEVGSPYANVMGGCEWAWIEPFGLDEPLDGGSPIVDDTPKPSADSGGFGLRLREVENQDVEGQA
jgi:hypothetical protein